MSNKPPFKYLPRDLDLSSYWEVHTTDPVFIAEHGPHCDHPVTTDFEAYGSKQDQYPHNWLGKCCVKCGFVTEGPTLLN